MYSPEERETVIRFDELDNAWYFETSVRKHITKIEKRIELYEILDEEIDKRGNRIYIRARMLDAGISPFAKPKRKLTDGQRQAISERARTRFKVTE